MQIVRKMVFCLLMLGVLIWVTGCWDKDEVNDIAVILAAGIEKSDDMIQLTVQLEAPVTQGSTGPQVEVKQGTGESIFDAMEYLQEKTPRKLFWGHNQVVFISKDIAEDGIHEHIDFFARYLETRLRTYVFVTDENIVDLMNVTPTLGLNAGEITKEIAQFQTGMNMDIRKALVMANNDIDTLAIPWLELDTEDPLISYRVNGIAIFKQNKMIAQLDDELTRGVLWVRDEIQQTSVTIRPDEAEKGYISFQLIESKTKVTPQYENGQWTITLDIQTIDDVTQNGTNLNVMKRKTRKKLEKQLAEHIKTRIESMLEIVQKEASADILNIGSTIYRKDPNEWKKIKDQWNEKFRDIDININVSAKIQRPGSSTKPQGLPEKKGK